MPASILEEFKAKGRKSSKFAKSGRYQKKKQKSHHPLVGKTPFYKDLLIETGITKLGKKEK